MIYGFTEAVERNNRKMAEFYLKSKGRLPDY